MLPFYWEFSHCFALNFYSANNARYSYIDAVPFGSILSVIGVVISILIGKDRKEHSFLWTAGLGYCPDGFAVCVFAIGALTVFIRGLIK